MDTTKTESNEMSTFLDVMAKSDQTRILKMQEKKRMRNSLHAQTGNSAFSLQQF